MSRVYLDYNATAPLRAEARIAMLEAIDLVGNPSSVHAEGRAAKGLIETARAQVAAMTYADRDEVIFTSGATEAAVAVLAQDWDTILVSEFCHDCITESLPRDAQLHWLDARNHLAALSDAEFLALLDVPTTGARKLLVVPAADGETGVVLQMKNMVLCDFAKQQGWHVLTDATQYMGRGMFDFTHELADARADYAILSAHKLGGPKGVGALLKKQHLPWRAVVTGGGQERGFRSGTENVSAIAGFGAAAEAAAHYADDWDRVAELRNILEKTIEDHARNTIFIGRDDARLPNTSCFVTPGWKGETQVMAMDLAGFAVSAGSACSSGKVKPSRVLRAMGFSEIEAVSAIRVSLGPKTTEDEILSFADAWLAAEKKFQAKAA